MGKTSAAAPRLLTTSEAARLVSHLTGQACSVRQFRYLVVQSGLGTDVQGRRRGETRLHGVIDVALARLALRLKDEGVSPWVTRVVLTYLRNDIVLAWRAGASVALAVRGIHGTLEPALKGKPKWAVAWVPLREVWRDLEQEIRRAREASPSVWIWRDVPAAHAASAAGGAL